MTPSLEYSWNGKTVLLWITKINYRIAAVVFLKLFWIVERVFFFLPTAPIKIWLGLWIMLPNFHGEFFMYNLLSDKLDRFEREIRKIRNQIYGKLTSVFLTSGQYVFTKSRAYIHTELLRSFREQIAAMHE